MLKLINNFKSRIEKEHNLIEAICISNSEGIMLSEHYIPRIVRNIYSHSKSFTSLMVGIAIDEGKLTLDTRLMDVFKDEVDEETYSRLYEIKVQDLLNMSSGFGEAYLMSSERVKGIGYPDYLKFLFSRELKYQPGSEFCYSNGDTYLAGRMVAKVYNEDFIRLCRPGY